MLQKFSNLLIRVNCLFINVRRNYFWRIVKIDHFLKHSLYSRFVACNVRIDFSIYANINALNDETMILSTRRNRFFRNVIELIFQMIIEIDFEKLFAQNIFQKIHVSSSDFEQKFENAFSCFFVYLYYLLMNFACMFKNL